MLRVMSPAAGKAEGRGDVNVRKPLFDIQTSVLEHHFTRVLIQIT